MLIRLKAGSSDPVYIQIADAIRVQIEDGSLEPGERLPSGRILAETLGVNMHTVLKAYEHLASRGLVEMRRGRGGVVVTGESALAGLVDSTIEEAKRQGITRPELLRMVEETW